MCRWQKVDENLVGATVGGKKLMKTLLEPLLMCVGGKKSMKTLGATVDVCRWQKVDENLVGATVDVCRWQKVDEPLLMCVQVAKSGSHVNVHS